MHTGWSMYWPGPFNYFQNFLYKMNSIMYVFQEVMNLEQGWHSYEFGVLGLLSNLCPVFWGFDLELILQELTISSKELGRNGSVRAVGDNRQHLKSLIFYSQKREKKGFFFLLNGVMYYGIRKEHFWLSTQYILCDLLQDDQTLCPWSARGAKAKI